MNFEKKKKYEKLHWPNNKEPIRENTLENKSEECLKKERD